MSALKLTSAHRARPMEGLTACGDAVVEVRDGAWNLFAVVDALGHGPDAEKSAKQAARAIDGAKGNPLEQVFEAVHRSLRNPTASPQGASRHPTASPQGASRHPTASPQGASRHPTASPHSSPEGASLHPTASAAAALRGVVMSALLIEEQAPGSDSWLATFAGVGNVELFVPEGVSRPVAMAGTLGAPSYRFRSFELKVSAGQRWVLASDGIKAREVGALLGKLRGESPEVVADALLSRVTRAHDDASVLVLDVEAA